MNLENLNFKNRSEDLESEDPSYIPEEIGEPKLIDQSDYIYPEDREPLDKEGRDKDEIAEYFKLKYGLLDESYISFDKKEGKWKINGMDPEEWKEFEDKIKNDRFH